MIVVKGIETGLLHLLWSFDSLGETYNLVVGDVRDVSAHVELVIYDLFVSNYGNTRQENYCSSPLMGGALAWAATAGNGSLVVLSDPVDRTDNDGNAFATFTMGSIDGTVTVTAGDGIETTSGSADFHQGPPPEDE